MSRRSRFFAPMMALALAGTVWVAAPATAAVATNSAVTSVASVTSGSVTSGSATSTSPAAESVASTNTAPAPQNKIVVQESNELADAQSERTTRLIVLSIIAIVLIALVIWLIRGIMRDHRKKNQR